jgi:hypothetical protein
MFRAAASAFAAISALHTSTPPYEAAQCKGVKLLKEQEIRGKYERQNTTGNQQCILINNAVLGAIPVAFRVDGGVARQQQPDDVNMTFISGRV